VNRKLQTTIAALAFTVLLTSPIGNTARADEAPPRPPTPASSRCCAACCSTTAPHRIRNRNPG